MTKKKIIKYKFGSFSGDGLGFGLAGDFDEGKVEKMRIVLNEAESKLRTVYRSEIKRLEKFVSEKFQVVPSEDDFITWFDRNKMYKNWEGLPKISDKEIFLATQEYLEKCKKLVDEIKKPKKKDDKVSIIQKNAKYDLKKLLFHFSDEVFVANTKKNDIEKVFSYPFNKPDSLLTLKINNKEFVLLLIEMQQQNLIIPKNLPSVLDSNSCFKSQQGKVLNRNDLYQAKRALKFTPLAPENENSIKELVKKIKMQ